jgi:hypothetical protein
MRKALECSFRSLQQLLSLVTQIFRHIKKTEQRCCSSAAQSSRAELERGNLVESDDSLRYLTPYIPDVRVPRSGSGHAFPNMTRHFLAVVVCYTAATATAFPVISQQRGAYRLHRNRRGCGYSGKSLVRIANVLREIFDGVKLVSTPPPYVRCASPNSSHGAIIHNNRTPI